MNNILEEYLVRIGADFDSKSFDSANRAVTQLAGSLDKLGSILKYGGIAIGIAKITAAVAGNIKAVADADMGYQKLAKDMWVTKETAKSFSLVMKTMGVSQDDIAWIPELREQFFRLRDEMNALATPSDADGQLRWIREIGYDVQRLQLKLKMFREWVAYYLIKYLQPYIKDFQNFVGWINDKIGRELPGFGKKTAWILSKILSMGLSVGRLLKNIFGKIYDFFDVLPVKTKQLVATFAIAGALLLSGPFGMFMVAIGTALLLLEDFFGYLDGKKSSKALAPLWRWLTDENNPFQKILKGAQDILSKILELLTILFTEIFTDERREQLKLAIQAIAQGLADIVDSLAEILSYASKGRFTIDSFWGKFIAGAGNAFEKTLALSKAFGQLLSGVSKFIKGDWSGAKNDLLSAFGGIGALGGVNPIFSGMAESFFGSASGADRAAQLVAEQPDNLIGNPNGCTFFIQSALGGDDEFMQSLGGNLWVPDWVSAAQKQGRFQSGTTGMRRGDIVVIDGIDGTAGDGDHVIMYDGNGGYYGNSTSKQRPVYGAMSDWDGKVLGYIRPGAMHGGFGGEYDISVNPSSYAAAYAAGQSNIMPASSNTYNNGLSMGNIIVNCGSATNPREIAAAMRHEIMDVSKTFAARNGGGRLV